MSLYTIRQSARRVYWRARGWNPTGRTTRLLVRRSPIDRSGAALLLAIVAGALVWRIWLVLPTTPAPIVIYATPAGRAASIEPLVSRPPTLPPAPTPQPVERAAPVVAPVMAPIAPAAPQPENGEGTHPVVHDLPAIVVDVAQPTVAPVEKTDVEGHKVNRKAYR